MFLDPNDDCKATFDEAKAFLQKYSEDVSEAKVRKFMERRDTNGTYCLGRSSRSRRRFNSLALT